MHVVMLQNNACRLLVGNLRFCTFLTFCLISMRDFRTALPLWILALILFKMVIRYGAYCSLMTGGSLLIANIIYSSIRNSNQLEIPFPEATLVFHWGWSFWMCMSMGKKK